MVHLYLYYFYENFLLNLIYYLPMNYIIVFFLLSNFTIIVHFDEVFSLVDYYSYFNLNLYYYPITLIIMYEKIRMNDYFMIII